MTYRYPTAFSYWSVEEQAAMARVIASEQYSMGQEVLAFEQEFAAHHHMKHGIMVNSGSSANLIAVASLFHKQDNPLKRGDKVFVPAVAWSTTYAPLVQHGLDLVLVDIDDTWNAAMMSAAEDMEVTPRLVVGCSILGNPAWLQFWKNYANLYGAYFIEDNCESLGAISRDKPGPYQKLCGTFGLLNTFSFYYSHQISAIEGGMILTDDDELADLCRCLRAHGWTRDIKPASAFDNEYEFTHFGYNVRPLELHAAIGREQLKKLPEFCRQRQQNYNNMILWTQDLPVKFPRRNGITSPFAINFTVEDKTTRFTLVEALRANGIDCRLPTGGSFRKHHYGKPWAEQETPNADKLHDTGLFLGNPPFPYEGEMLRAVRIMEKVLLG